MAKGKGRGQIPLTVLSLLVIVAIVSAAFVLSGGAGSVPIPPLTGAHLDGAIFTTTPDGSIVNENVHYTKKIEVYLDGGPPPNAPVTSAGLPEDLYVFGKR